MGKIHANCFICNKVPVVPEAPAPADLNLGSGGGPRHRAKNLFILLQRVLDLDDLAVDQSELAYQISFCKLCLDELEVTEGILDAFEKVKKMAERHKSGIQSKFLESKGQGSHSKSNKNLEIGGVTELRSQMVAELKSTSGSASALMTVSSKTLGVFKRVTRTRTAKHNLPKDSAGGSRNVDSFELNGEDDVLSIAKELISSDDIGSEQRPSTPLPVVPTTKARRSGVGQKKQVTNGPRNSNQQIRQGEKKLPTKPCTPRNVPRPVPRKTPMKLHEKKHKCQLCPAMFKQKCKLTQHLRIHTGEEPFSCLSCPKTFSRKSYLKEHQVVHSGEKRFRCKFCPKTVARRNDLTIHERVHTGERPYTCKMCLKAFAQHGHLVTHMRTHTREKPYPCKMCSKTFSESGTLVNHMRTHTGEKPFKCTVCSKEFTQLGNLKAHKNTQHLHD